MTTLHLIIGSEQGNTEALADDLKQVLEERQWQVILHDQPNYQDIPQSNCYWLICTATFGAGDFPYNIQDFFDQLMTEQPDLSLINYGVIAIGDQSYDTFCQAGKNIDQLLAKLGAHQTQARLEICVQNTEDPLAVSTKWLFEWLKN